MSEEYIEEKALDNMAKGISFDVFEELAQKMKTQICKIKIKEGQGTGFFCNIPNGWNTLRMLITNNHVLKEEDISKGKKINFSINKEKIHYEIEIDESRKIYTSEKYDITMIELKEKDKIEKDSFMDVDSQIFKENPNEIYKNKQIYLLHYPKGEQMVFSNGIIKNINEYTIQHLCDSSGGSSGGPLINANNYRVIGVHKGGAIKGRNYNLGTLIKEPIENLTEEKNEEKNKNENITEKSNEDKDVRIKEEEEDRKMEKDDNIKREIITEDIKNKVENRDKKEKPKEEEKNFERDNIEKEIITENIKNKVENNNNRDKNEKPKEEDKNLERDNIEREAFEEVIKKIDLNNKVNNQENEKLIECDNIVVDREKNSHNKGQEKINNDRGDNLDDSEKKENKKEDILNTPIQEANIVNEKSEKEITTKKEEKIQKFENIIINNPKYGNYENFSVNEMKRLSRTEIYSNDAKILVLKDGRLLIYYDKMINIYNLNNNNLDIIFNNENFSINNVIQMDDGHLIVSSYILNVYKIKEKNLEITQTSLFSKIVSKKVFKLSNNIILFKDNDGIITFMKYLNGKLEKLNEKPIKQKHITNILEINDNELALYYMDKNIFSEGYSTSIYFYDRKKNKKKEVEIGNVKNDDDSDIIPFELIKGNYIITANSKNIILIDVKTYKKIIQISPDKSIYNFSITLLNKNNFLFLFKAEKYSEVSLFQYEFEENEKLLNLTEKFDLGFNGTPECIKKYFENKLIIKRRKENIIEIYG